MRRAPDDLRTAAWSALPIWVFSRIAVAAISIAGLWMVQAPEAAGRPGFLQIWDRWDVGLFRKVAEFGYFSPAYDDRAEVDFPALPLLLRAVHAVVGDWIAAGLIISAVAGAVACVALWRLASLDGGRLAGDRAVLYLVLAPYAVFLFAGYSEALFLAFGVSAFLAARQERWLLAALLASGATFTRITGVALAAGVGVEYLVARRRATRSAGPLLSWRGVRALLDRRAAYLALPVLPVAGYVYYLYLRTGHWDAYQRAQEAGWSRRTASPVEGFRTTLDAATNLQQPANYLWSWRAEFLAVMVGLVLGLVLLYLRRYGEATFVGANAVLLAAQNYYTSSVRAALVWFPVYLLLARLSLRREWLHQLVVWVGAGLMAVGVVAFTQGRWIG
jgi:hypothetical protein